MRWGVLAALVLAGCERAEPAVMGWPGPGMRLLACTDGAEGAALAWVKSYDLRGGVVQYVDYADRRHWIEARPGRRIVACTALTEAEAFMEPTR